MAEKEKREPKSSEFFLLFSLFRPSQIAGDAVGAEVIDKSADAEEVAADFGAVRIGPDLGFAMQEGGGVDAGPAACEGDVPVEFMLCGIGEGPRELSFIPAQFGGQGEFPAWLLDEEDSGRGSVMKG